TFCLKLLLFFLVNIEPFQPKLPRPVFMIK
ncbi:MAG: hypothetical protein ACI935_003413, partial [Moritella dasanensis]